MTFATLKEFCEGTAGEMTQTISTCNPSSSKTILYWYTYKPNMQRILSESFVAAGEGQTTQQGIPGFANKAFGKMPGPTMIASAEGGEEAYKRATEFREEVYLLSSEGVAQLGPEAPQIMTPMEADLRSMAHDGRVFGIRRFGRAKTAAHGRGGARGF